MLTRVLLSFFVIATTAQCDNDEMCFFSGHACGGACNTTTKMCEDSLDCSSQSLQCGNRIQDDPRISLGEECTRLSLPCEPSLCCSFHGFCGICLNEYPPPQTGPAPAYVNQGCVECNMHEDCQVDQFCSSNRCYKQTTNCTGNDDCWNSKICVDNMCIINCEDRYLEDGECYQCLTEEHCLHHDACLTTCEEHECV